MSAYKIEKGIPLHDAKNARGKHRYPFLDMEVGDSFFVPDEDDLTPTKLQNRITAYSAFFKPRRFATRRVPGGHRCWRVE